MKLEQMTFEEIYLEFFSNFLTIERMAEYYQVPQQLLENWVSSGRAIHNGQSWAEFEDQAHNFYLNNI